MERGDNQRVKLKVSWKNPISGPLLILNGWGWVPQNDCCHNCNCDIYEIYEFNCGVEYTTKYGDIDIWINECQGCGCNEWISWQFCTEDGAYDNYTDEQVEREIALRSKVKKNVLDNG
jgi:hypothetical protein